MENNCNSTYRIDKCSSINYRHFSLFFLSANINCFCFFFDFLINHFSISLYFIKLVSLSPFFKSTHLLQRYLAICFSFLIPSLHIQFSRKSFPHEKSEKKPFFFQHTFSIRWHYLVFYYYCYYY